MLKKLFKYDFQAIFRYWWIIICTQLGVSAIAAFVLKFVVDYQGSDELGLIRVCCILFLVFAALAIFLAPLLSSLLCYIRFYKNLFTDEGYLTFTLPVTRRQILLSKTLTTALFSFVDLLSTLGCTFFVLLIGLSGLEPSFGEGLGVMLGSLLNLFGGGWVVVLISALVTYLGMILFGFSAIFLCITLGATVFKKLKVLGAIGIYYAGQLVLQLVVQILGTIASLFMIEGLITAFSNATMGQGVAIVSLILLAFAAAFFCVGFIFYFTMLGIVERKLNLP